MNIYLAGFAKNVPGRFFAWRWALPTSKPGWLLKMEGCLMSSLAPRHSPGTGLTEGGSMEAVHPKHRGGEGRLLTL